MVDLAESISREPGFIWKICTENPKTRQAGGVYLFTDRSSEQAYQAKHLERLKSFGITDTLSRLFGVDEALTKMTSGPV